MLGYFMDAIGIEGKRIVRASALRPEGQRSEMLLDICRKVDGDIYLSGVSGREYLDPAPFEAAGVEVCFQEFHHPEYDQGYPDFAPNMGVVDALLNCGGRAVRGILEEVINE